MNQERVLPGIPKLMQGEGIQQFEFFQAVKLLEAMMPQVAKVGETSSPEEELLRFKTVVDFAFPAGDSHCLELGEEGGTLHFWVQFMGLCSHFGPMPDAFTNWIMHQNSNKNFAMRDFIDLFNHRLISLMVRIRRKHRLGLEQKQPQDTMFANYLFSLLGLGSPHLRNRQTVRDKVFLNYNGLLLRQSRSMPGLESILNDLFRIPVRGEQFVGGWRPLEEDVRTEIGFGGRNRALGQGCVLGKSVWDQQASIALHLGPMGESDFLKFLPLSKHYSEEDCEKFKPVGSLYPALVALTKFYLGVEFDFHLHIILKTERLPSAILSSRKGKGALLGWTSWLTAKSVDVYPIVRISNCRGRR